jgi:hypothetical protein
MTGGNTCCHLPFLWCQKITGRVQGNPLPDPAICSAMSLRSEDVDVIVLQGTIRNTRSRRRLRSFSRPRTLTSCQPKGSQRS